ncbi:bifunctional diaminohydroxyphosphoribosylaminopyrimidine deaminase/5-amino-6-(5-phosphoribosylamino)uracil reductase RibD [Candidatus Poriferisodalis sp.]|uniref:bifunctional diaminohydroxyphosphoribosylaminopyrimidine deaminase/5-amino-6-(5-phosphoribosylamino)uracil reductase RibD n=1 Tax=Candidatus Poriferisodalis sp. TaxID=3101277 RepID=UPI003B0152A4
MTDLPAPETDASVEGAMQRAVELGECVRGTTAPNPWVGAVLITTDGQTFEGATEPPPGRHAEIVALDAARDVGADSVGGTLVTTLEPCSHTGRTAPCIEAVISADIARVVVGVTDPDPNVAGTGIEALRDAGIEVQVAAVFGDEVGEGVSLAPAAAVSLRPYLHQRRYGRPWVVLKMAATLDGRIGAPDGTSQWITSPTARADVHALRARCDAVLVGAGTVRSDNPSLTVRDLPDDSPHRPLFDLRERLRDGHPNPATLPFSVAAAERLDPRRYVLGLASADASVQPCSEESGALRGVLRRLAADGVIEMLVEGGAQIAGELHRDGFVDEYVVYLAPALSGGDDGLPMLAGPGAPTIGEFWRGEIADTRTIGADVRITMHPRAQQTIDPSDIAGTAGHGARPPNEH